MNIRHNRYVLFLGPLLWCIVAMCTTRTVEHGILTLWLTCTSAFDYIEISHKRAWKYTPDQIGEFRNTMLNGTIFTGVFAALGFPRLSLIGFATVRAKYSPPRLAFVFGCIWFVWYLISFVVHFEFILGASPRWYGIILILWGVLVYAGKLELVDLGHSRFGLKVYTTVWLFRFVDQLLMNSIRWMVWCDCVFPYVMRWDLYLLGMVVTGVCSWAVNLKKPAKILRFTKSLGDHMPAPDADSALLCNMCRESQYTVDVEEGGGERSGFTLYEDDETYAL